MSIRRFLFWLLFTLTCFGFASWVTTKNFDLWLIMGLSGLFGLFMMIFTIYQFKKIRLSNNILHVRQYFRTELKLNLETLKCWKQEDFHFRGNLTKVLTLTTIDRKTIRITDGDNINEYEKLYHYLRVKMDERKK